MNTTTEPPVHPLVRALPDGVLFGRPGSALIWCEKHRTGMQVMPTLADLADERRRRHLARGYTTERNQR